LKLKTFAQSDIKGKKVLARVDFNVPLSSDGKVADNTRINAHIPLIGELSAAGARTALISHLGRPKGVPTPKYSLKPVADELASSIGRKVDFASDCVGDEAERSVNSLSPGDVVV
jgi:phosphoglycerate kinase